MKLYRYFDEHGIDVLKNLRLKVSDPNQFNDPFELLPAISGDIKKSVVEKRMQDPEFKDHAFDQFSRKMNFSKREEFEKFWKRQSFTDDQLNVIRTQLLPDLRKTALKWKEITSERLFFGSFLWGEQRNEHTINHIKSLP